MPGLPMGLTLDSFSNQLARLGANTTSMNEATEYVRRNYTADYQTMNNLYRHSWVVKRLIDVVPEDMTKNWYRISSQLSPDAKQQITRLERRAKIRSRVLEGLKWGRLYGGAAGVIIIEGHDDILHEPLDLDMIMPGSFRGLLILDRWCGISPSLGLVRDISDPDFGLPEYYNVTAPALGYTVQVHHSRIVRFIGRPMPYIEQVMEMYWGTSEIEHVMDELKKYDNTSYNMAALVFSANLKVYKMEGFDQIATMPDTVQRDLYNTLTFMNWMMCSQGMQIMGATDEFHTHQYSFSGLSDIYEMFMMDVAGSAEIPVTKLFMRSPAGMNATGESDLQNYYDSLEEKQEAQFRPVIDKILPIMCMSEFGAVPDDLDFEFNPVRRPTEEEKKNITRNTSEAVVSTYNAGIINQKIALTELRESSEATGMWDSITDKDIEKADSGFGPPDGVAPSSGMSAGYEMPEQDGGTVCDAKERPCRAADPSKCRVHGSGGGPSGGGSKSSAAKHKAVNKALGEIAAGAAEATVSGLRGDLEQFGGTNDVTFVRGDEKKGLVHIASKHGVEAVPRVIDAVVDGEISKYVPGKKTIHIEKDGYEAILSLDEHGKKKTWLLTGWKIDT
jgi:phage-related protein (TIGR01555 family)